MARAPRRRRSVDRKALSVDGEVRTTGQGRRQKESEGLPGYARRNGMILQEHRKRAGTVGGSDVLAGWFCCRIPPRLPLEHRLRRRNKPSTQLPLRLSPDSRVLCWGARRSASGKLFRFLAWIVGNLEVGSTSPRSFPLAVPVNSANGTFTARSESGQNHCGAGPALGSHSEASKVLHPHTGAAPQGARRFPRSLEKRIMHQRDGYHCRFWEYQ